MTGVTPSQTVGPYFRIGMDWPRAYRLADPACTDAVIVVSGQVLDGDGAPVPDGLIEIWQADPAGVYHPQGSSTFRCAGRVALDTDGRYLFETVKPGRVGGPGGRKQAPHINLTLFARGLLVHLRTRIYFADEAAANAADAILGLVPEARRASLLALRDGGHYRYDIHLQGPQETVFFDV